MKPSFLHDFHIFSWVNQIKSATEPALPWRSSSAAVYGCRVPPGPWISCWWPRTRGEVQQLDGKGNCCGPTKITLLFSIYIYYVYIYILCVYIYIYIMCIYIYIYIMCVYIYIYTWGVPQMGVPPVIIHSNRIFPHKPSSYWGTPIYGTPLS